MKKLFLLLVFCVQTQAQEYQVASSGDATFKISSELKGSAGIASWLTTVWAKMAEYRTPLRKEIFVLPSAEGRTNSDPCGGKVFLSPALVEQGGDNLAYALVHELGHAGFSPSPCEGNSAWGNTPVEEGLTDAVARQLWSVLRPELPSTAIWSMDVGNNVPWFVGGGSSSYLQNQTPFGYGPTAGVWEMFGLGAIKTLDQAYAQVFRWQEARIATDLALPALRFDGVLPSTFMGWLKSGFVLPDLWRQGLKTTGNGKFLVALAEGYPSGWYSSPAPVNPQLFRAMLFSRESTVWQGTKLLPLPCSVKFEVWDSQGNLVWNQTQKGLPQAAVEPPANLPEGAYKLVVRQIDGDSAPQPFVTFFAVYRKEWTKGKLLLFTNGQEFSNLGWKNLWPESPALWACYSITNGLFVLDVAKVGCKAESLSVGITDGEVTRQFTLPAPMPGQSSSVSRISFWKQLDDPLILGAETPAPVDGLLSLLTLGTTDNDPSPMAEADPTFGCSGPRGSTRVFFGDQPAEIRSCSAEKISVSVPQGWDGIAPIRVQKNGVWSPPFTLTP